MIVRLRSGLIHIGVIGGTGPEGRGLAARLSLAGHSVLLGSRDPTRAADRASELSRMIPAVSVRGVSNRIAAADADLVLVTVPYVAQRKILESLSLELADKLVVTTVVPIDFVNGRARAIAVPEGSAALQAADVLPRSTVAATFHNVSAHDLIDAPEPVDSDVVVFSDDPTACRVVMSLAACIPGVRSLNGGGLEGARYLEDLTALILNINRIYHANATIRFTGISFDTEGSSDSRQHGH